MADNRTRRPGGRTEEEAKAAGAQSIAQLGTIESESGTLGAILDRWVQFQRACGLSKVARHVWDKAGLLEDRPGTRVLHDLRATAASFMADAGFGTDTLQSNLGWKTREVVERYVKAFEQTKNEAVDAAADALL